QLQTWAKLPATPGEIDPRFVKYQPQASGPYVDYKLGMAYYKAGNYKLAKRFLGHLVSSYPSSSLAREAKPLLAQMGYKPKKKKVGAGIRVGVILPLSGKYERFGQSTLNGMECAAGTKAGCAGLGNIELIIRDDGGSPGSAIEAVQTLVEQENVVAIVGPLSSASALAAAKKAQELGVTMISLAQKQGIPNVGNQIFRFSLTPNQQIKALLAYTTKKKGKKSIGVFYPKNNYGKVFMEKFKSLAPSYGAAVTASHSYTNSQDAQGDIRNLKFSVSKSSPEAPIGFNALFIPDSFMAILNLLPQLKVSGLETMLLLGTNAWNDPALAQRSGGNLGDAVFLDIYFKGAKNNRVKTFIREYQAAFGQTPTTLEAMGYDIIRFISEMAVKNKIRSRPDFRNALDGTSGYNGVTGLRSFASNREARLRPYMLTVTGSQIQEIQ
ncbi:MAG: penicillin-binding protein activator, partial [bacterium]|nr:penicillin-binding protein activator [bacterium]